VNRLTFSLDIIRKNKKEYFGLNILYYGLVTASMVFTYFIPDVQSGLLELIRSGITDVFPWIVEAYKSGNFPLAAVLTFLINLFLGSFVYITLPALIIPFGGIALGCVRAVGWGLVLAPTSPELARAMITHSLVVVLEGQGYILAMFAVYLLWKGVLWPKSRGEKTRSKAYLTGIRKTAHIYLLVILVLAISAIYEAFEVIYIVGYTFLFG
jgi:hypothetical protein